MTIVNNRSLCLIAERPPHSSTHLIPPRAKEYLSLAETGFIVKEKRGVLIMSGNDALSLLGRMSTNDLTLLGKGKNVCTTILTTEKAKIVDIITVLMIDTKILIITSADIQYNVKTWLEKYIIMEDVHLQDVTSEYSVHMLFGEKMLRNITANATNALAADTCYNDREQGYQVFANTLWKVPVFTLVSAEKQSTRFQQEVMQVDPSIIETLRVENGIPVYGKELTDEINPLEAGLGQYISFTKGCYIGQEVIARIDTYGRLHKRLVGLVFNERSEMLLNVGKLYLSTNEVGYTTSHVWSPTLQNYIALGFLNNTAGTAHIMFKHDNMESPVEVSVNSLPFNELSGNRG